MSDQITLPGIETVKSYHDFMQKLAYANANTQTNQLDAFYKANFPGVVEVEKVSDLLLQRQGIDTMLKLESGKIVFFDEKVRSKDWGDILLEEYSVWKDWPQLNGSEVGKYEPVNNSIAKQHGLVVGWLGKQKITDYITYIFKPSKRAFFLPFLLLQRAWGIHYTRWVAKYGRVNAKNKTYTTTSVPVPIDTLYKSLYEEAKWS